MKSLHGNITLHYSAYIHEIEASNGTINALSSLETNRVEAGAIFVQGNLNSAEVRTTQSGLSVQGHLKCTTVETNGDCQVAGDSEFEHIKGGGQLALLGQTNGERLVCEADLLLGGSCSVDSISWMVHGCSPTARS